MTNAYYNPTGAPAQGSAVTSAVVRTEFAAIQAGFDKMPALTGNGNKLIYINAAETAQSAVGSAEVITFLASPTSANLAALVSDETGSGSLVFNTSPVFTTDISINSAAGTPVLKFTQGGTRTGSVECSGGDVYLRNASLNVTAAFRQGVSSPTSYVVVTASDTGLPKISTSASGTSLVLGAGAATVLTLSGSGANSVTIANSATNPVIGTSAGGLTFQANANWLNNQAAGTSIPILYFANVTTGQLGRVQCSNAGVMEIAAIVGGGSVNIGSPLTATNQTVGTTVGAAGGASALPATPLGYLTTNINGSACKIPYYN